MLLTSCTRSRVYYVRNYRGREHELERLVLFAAKMRQELTADKDVNGSSRLQVALIALNLLRGFYEIYSGTGVI